MGTRQNWWCKASCTCWNHATSVQAVEHPRRADRDKTDGPKIRARHWKGNPSKAERDEDKATQLTFPSWCTCCGEGKVSGQLNRCCSSGGDVSEMQLDQILAVSKGMRSEHSALTCDSRDCCVRVTSIWD